MKQSTILALFCLLALASCKKEIIEKHETIVEKTVYIPIDNAFTVDTFVGTPNGWQKRNAREHWKTIEHDSILTNRTIDVYLGKNSNEWLNLPYTNVQDNIVINYFWRDGSVTLMAYGDSAILNSSTYWVVFKDEIRIRISKKL